MPEAAACWLRSRTAHHLNRRGSTGWTRWSTARRFGPRMVLDRQFVERPPSRLFRRCWMDVFQMAIERHARQVRRPSGHGPRRAMGGDNAQHHNIGPGAARSGGCPQLRRAPSRHVSAGYFHRQPSATSPGTAEHLGDGASGCPGWTTALAVVAVPAQQPGRSRRRHLPQAGQAATDELPFDPPNQPAIDFYGRPP